MSTHDLAAAVLTAANARPDGTWLASVISVDAPAVTVDVRLLGVDLVGVPYLGGPYWVGDTVMLAWNDSQVLAVNRVGTAEVATTPPEQNVTTPPRQTITTPIAPTFRGTYRGSGWLSDTSIRQGEWGWGNNYGAAFYSDAFMALAVDLTAERSAQLNLRRGPGGVYAAQTPTLRLFTQRTRPAGMPTVMDQQPGPPLAVGDTKTWQMPTAWLDELATGDAGGIGVGAPTGEPYIVFGDSAAQFVVSVTYKAEG